MKITNIHLDTIDSTNSYAKREYRSFPKDGVICIVADAQTAGRGRYDRTWISPPKVNLYITFYFQTQNRGNVQNLAQIMAHSFISLLLAKGLHPKIKWPNDIQLHGKKVSGVLCEIQFLPTHVDVFLGIGINVNMELHELQQIGQPATSLQNETGTSWDRSSLLKDLQTRFLSDLERFQKEGFAPFQKLLDETLAYKGEEIRCFDGNKEWIGVCKAIAKNGQLQIELPDGAIFEISSGDVEKIDTT